MADPKDFMLPWDWETVRVADEAAIDIVTPEDTTIS